ncbi:MAG: hypothetical protein EPO28_04070 [Saprospiraceae bacterium]|nr:MAG: hypothetical protein EPO28_04070 [Saprospiraceae bacterium]
MDGQDGPHLEARDKRCGQHIKRVDVQPQKDKEGVQKAVTYFTNQLERMNYAAMLKKNRPIGSGVTEAACKTLVNQRLCNSGMRWYSDAMDKILMARSLSYSADRWSQFRNKIDRYGFICTS